MRNCKAERLWRRLLYCCKIMNDNRAWKNIGFDTQILPLNIGMQYLVGSYNINAPASLQLIFVGPSLPNHYRCRVLFLHLITLNDTHTHIPPLSVSLFWQESTIRVISPTQRPLPDNTQQSQQTFIPLTRFNAMTHMKIKHIFITN